MSIQYVNTGSSPNKGDGDSLRAAFGKINYNFSQFENMINESSATISINSFPPLNPGEGELWYDTVSGRSFIYYDSSWVDANPTSVDPNVGTNTANLLFTTGTMYSSTGVMISNQGTITGATAWISIPTDAGPNINLQNNYGTITLVAGQDPGNTKIWNYSTSGQLTAPGHIIPDADLTYDLGSTSSQWRSLYVGTSTIYLGGIELSLNTNSSLTVNGLPVVSYNTSGNFIVDGNTISGADTGDVTFSTNVVQGTGYELGLSPGTGFTTDTQYFRIRGGDVPDHLHFDTTNNFSFDLYVGDDQKYFKLSKDGPAIIGTQNTVTSNLYTWNFDTSGNLTVPGPIVSSPILATGTQVSGIRAWDGSGINLYVWMEAGSDPLIVELGSYGSLDGWTVSVDGGNSAIITATNAAGFFSITTDQPLTGFPGTLTFTSPDYVPASANNIAIGAGSSTWAFKTDGSLNLPSNLSITPAGNFIPVLGTAILQGTDEWILIVSSGTNAVTQIGWAEDPFNASQSASISFNADNSGEVRILTGSFTSTINTWAFGLNGNLTFPDGTTQTTAFVIANSPVSSTATGTTGTIAFDASYFYVCTATNSWQRVAWDSTPW